MFVNVMSIFMPNVILKYIQISLFALALKSKVLVFMICKSFKFNVYWYNDLPLLQYFYILASPVASKQFKRCWSCFELFA